jgi:tripartite ATP-independent transporter DctM subunit
MDLETALPLLMFASLLAVMLLGYPVAFSLAGVALIFAWIGTINEVFYFEDLAFVSSRIFGILQNQTLIAVPMFIMMGITLDQSGLAKELLETMQQVLKRVRGGLALSVILVGALLAASTGIVGATVVTMGAIALPTMLKWGYQKELACGTIAASGTLGQIIPPSIVLVLLGDMMSVDVSDLFMGAIFPGLMLVTLYMVYVWIKVLRHPNCAPLPTDSEGSTPMSHSHWSKALLPPLALMIIVLGTILTGMASPTEASACGAIGALLITSLKGKLSKKLLHGVLQKTVHMTTMVFTILVGAQFFGVVFRGLQGDEVIQNFITNSQIPPGGVLAFVMILMFVMGFFLDFIEICFIIIPVVGPILIKTCGLDPLWVAILMAINLQTSFLTPPFGFALFYLKGTAPPEIQTSHIYRGVLPFVILQIMAIVILMIFPEIVTWLPRYLNSS